MQTATYYSWGNMNNMQYTDYTLVHVYWSKDWFSGMAELQPGLHGDLLTY